MQFHEAKLDNGLQVIAELNPQVHSVAMGFFVRAGSRDETSEVAGVSHFLEHMAFKGNEKHTAEDVNRIFDEVGAKYNASTSEEVTLFYGAILPEYLDKTFELLAGLIFPSLRQDDFDMEKNVILEEIGMYDDQPSFSAYEQIMKTHFAGHPLSRSILGSNDSISALTSEQMRQYHKDHYLSGNITLAVAGNTDWDEVMQLANQWCGNWPSGCFERPTHEAQPTGGVDLLSKDASQMQHIMQMCPAPSAKDVRRFAAEILTVIVGDDGGSRLYWDLVDPGIVEAAELGFNEYDGSGTFLTYMCAEPDTTVENLERIHAIYEDVNKNGVSQVELDQAKNKVASRVVLKSERPMGRLSSLGGNWVYRQEYRTVKDDLETLRSISLNDISELLEAYPLAWTTTAGVGPLAALQS